MKRRWSFDDVFFVAVCKWALMYGPPKSSRDCSQCKRGNEMCFHNLTAIMLCQKSHENPHILLQKNASYNGM